jgi:aminopeptidase
MSEYSEIILNKCLGLKNDEKFLIVTDSKLKDIAQDFYEHSKKITDNVKLIEIGIPKIHATEPSEEVAKEMLNYEVELLITSKSLSHTNARIDASNNGARIVTMPGITKEILERTIDIDYDKLMEVHEKLGDIIDGGKEVKIKTSLGTDFSFSISGREGFGRDSGLFTRKGSFGNLPTGEIFVAPVEGTAEGVFVADASFGGIGKLKEPLKVYVERGYVVKVEGEKSDILEGLLDSIGKEARNIAEFGIGTNEKAKITGNILEDEKVVGTCHIALGNNVGFGGKVNVKLHLDGIIKNPTIFVDDKKIMYDGKFLI